MDRRDFLRSALAGSALYAAGTLPGLESLAHATPFPALAGRVLINVTLDGGPDLRHLFPPAFDPDPASYGYRYWQAMAPAHDIADTGAAYEARWLEDYLPLSHAGLDFGVLAKCGWLRRMWDRGKVAIVSNVLGASTRDHGYSLLVLNRGDRNAGKNDPDSSGWGGRLAAVSGGRVLALTQTPSAFCYGPDPSDPEGYDNSNLIAAANTRALSLYHPPADASAEELRIARSLKAYYAAKRMEMPADSIYRRFVDLEAKLRTFGEPVEERLSGVPVPDAIETLYGEVPRLFDASFGEQMRNVHDVLACSDILSPRVLSLAYPGFDTHDDQRDELEPRLGDIFGDGMALDSLYQELPPELQEKLVLVLAGEFGRQLRANGDNGTDHGEGATVLIIGEGVRGGVYGDMFPEAELARLEDASPQITGQTAIEQVFGAVCDWVFPGSGDSVFPLRAEAPLEGGVALEQLFT